MKTVFLLAILVSPYLISFEPPKKDKPNPKKNELTQPLMQQQRPEVKKVGQSEFVNAAHYFKTPFAISNLIASGATITPAELYQLINVQTGENASYNITFWLHFGTHFLMYGTVKALHSPTGQELKSLQDLAADAIFKDTNIERRGRALQNPIFRELASLKNLAEIKQEIEKTFEKVIKADEGGISTQKLKIRQEMRIKAEQHLTQLWREVVNTQPSGFSVTVLEYILQVLWSNPTLVHNAQILVKQYIALWVENRCQQLLKITQYIKAKGALQPILNAVKNAYLILLQGFELRPHLLTRQDMDDYYDFSSLLRATPQTCPAIVQILLIKRLGPKATDILENKAGQGIFARFKNVFN